MCLVLAIDVVVNGVKRVKSGTRRVRSNWQLDQLEPLGI